MSGFNQAAEGETAAETVQRFLDRQAAATPTFDPARYPQVYAVALVQSHRHDFSAYAGDIPDYATFTEDLAASVLDTYIQRTGQDRDTVLCTFARGYLTEFRYTGWTDEDLAYRDGMDRLTLRD